jgi:hypothetical protein
MRLCLHLVFPTTSQKVLLEVGEDIKKEVLIEPLLS